MATLSPVYDYRFSAAGPRNQGHAFCRDATGEGIQAATTHPAGSGALEVAEFVFAHPVATPVQMGRETGIHYKTASRYLAQLAAEGLLENKQVGRYQFYLNRPLLEILSRS
ncbi:Fic family protein [Hymenobacter amundsenii]|uniref:hypothetical protein n=1 Tax=Hymenobacter amundsenii TaxID=2006685 RepID=UPI003742B4E1